MSRVRREDQAASGLGSCDKHLVRDRKRRHAATSNQIPPPGGGGNSRENN